MSGGSSRSSSCGSWTSQARRDAAVELSIEEARIALLHDHVALLEKDAPEVAALEAAVVEAKEAKRLAQMRGEDEAYALRGASQEELRALRRRHDEALAERRRHHAAELGQARARHRRELEEAAALWGRRRDEMIAVARDTLEELVDTSAHDARLRAAVVARVSESHAAELRATRDAEPPLVSWDARTEPERLLLGGVWDLETAIKS
jgi:hypothetical protein